MSHVHPFTIASQVSLDEEYGDSRVSSGGLPADELAFLDSAVYPSDAEMQRMHDEHRQRAEDEFAAIQCDEAALLKKHAHLLDASDDALIHQIAYPWSAEVAAAAALILAQRLDAQQVDDLTFLDGAELAAEAALRDFDQRHAEREREARKQGMESWCRAFRDMPTPWLASLLTHIPESTMFTPDELERLIVNELMLRSGGAYGGPSRPVTPPVRSIPWSATAGWAMPRHTSSRKRIPARAMLGL